MVYERIKALLSEQLGIDESEITPESNILEDLGADSLDVVELISNLEDEFNLMITDERIREAVTVGDVAAFIENLI